MMVEQRMEDRRNFLTAWTILSGHSDFDGKVWGAIPAGQRCRFDHYRLRLLSNIAGLLRRGTAPATGQKQGQTHDRLDISHVDLGAIGVGAGPPVQERHGPLSDGGRL